MTKGYSLICCIFKRLPPRLMFSICKVCLIASLFPSEALEDLIFKGSTVKLQLCVLDPLILAVQRSPGSVPQKGFDRLIHFDPGRKCFYLGNISD